MFDNLFFDARRYDLARVGRYKLNKKLGWRQRMLGQTLAQPIVDPETGEIILDAGVQVGKNNLISLLVAMFSMVKVLLNSIS